MHDWYLEGSLKFKADVTNGLENVLVFIKECLTEIMSERHW